jgi:hypothetical protein
MPWTLEQIEDDPALKSVSQKLATIISITQRA